jgi:hypothetical protein
MTINPDFPVICGFSLLWILFGIGISASHGFDERQTLREDIEFVAGELDVCLVELAINEGLL